MTGNSLSTLAPTLKNHNTFSAYYKMESHAGSYALGQAIGKVNEGAESPICFDSVKNYIIERLGGMYCRSFSGSDLFAGVPQRYEGCITKIVDYFLTEGKKCLAAYPIFSHSECKTQCHCAMVYTGQNFKIERRDLFDGTYNIERIYTDENVALSYGHVDHLLSLAVAKNVQSVVSQNNNVLTIKLTPPEKVDAETELDLDRFESRRTLLADEFYSISEENNKITITAKKEGGLSNKNSDHGLAFNHISSETQHEKMVRSLDALDQHVLESRKNARYCYANQLPIFTETLLKKDHFLYPTMIKHLQSLSKEDAARIVNGYVFDKSGYHPLGIVALSNQPKKWDDLIALGANPKAPLEPNLNTTVLEAIASSSAYSEEMKAKVLS